MTPRRSPAAPSPPAPAALRPVEVRSSADRPHRREVESDQGLAAAAEEASASWVALLLGQEVDSPPSPMLVEDPGQVPQPQDANSSSALRSLTRTAREATPPPVLPSIPPAPPPSPFRPHEVRPARSGPHQASLQPPAPRCRPQLRSNIARQAITCTCIPCRTRTRTRRLPLRLRRRWRCTRSRVGTS